MDEACQHCPALRQSRSRIVHGFGDVTADFLFVTHAPTADANRTGIPFGGSDTDSIMWSILDRVGFISGTLDGDPRTENVYLTHLTRCRHPDRMPTSEERANCEPFLNADIRMINPEILIPIGEIALQELAFEYTTKSPDSFDIDRDHGAEIRGRGFEIIPMKHPSRMTSDDVETIVSRLQSVLDRDYRQTKGGRRR